MVHKIISKLKNIRKSVIVYLPTTSAVMIMIKTTVDTSHFSSLWRISCKKDLASDAAFVTSCMSAEFPSSKIVVAAKMMMPRRKVKSCTVRIETAKVASLVIREY